MKRSKKSAFTLVEMMIVVAIIADVMIIAVPSFMRARTRVQDTKFISDLRVASGAFEMYAAENNRYPANSAPSVIPTGMASYFGSTDWTTPTPIGGAWDWEPTTSNPACLGVRFTPSGNDTRMSDIDLRIDNGALTTGSFRKESNQFYQLIIE